MDTHVTSPSYFDWYTVSHNSLQGTSRPAKYTVLYDDIGVDPDAIQLLVSSSKMCSVIPARLTLFFRCFTWLGCLVEPRNRSASIQRQDMQICSAIEQEFLCVRSTCHNELSLHLSIKAINTGQDILLRESEMICFTSNVILSTRKMMYRGLHCRNVSAMENLSD